MKQTSKNKQKEEINDKLNKSVVEAENDID